MSTIPAAPLRQPTSTRRVAAAATVGTALESYDFYAYSYFAAFFAGPFFFSALGETGALLASFATIGIAFVVRPIGAVLFGHLGDRIGRRSTLLITITLMGIATGLVGLLPTGEGWAAFGAVALVVLRIVQGLSLGGEWGGAVLLATEHADARRRPFFASLPQLGSPIGSVAAGGLMLAMFFGLGPEAMAAWGWRVPFLIAIPLIAVSLYLRWSIDETPVFKELAERGERAKNPVWAAIRTQPAAFGVAILVALLGIGSYSLMNTYTMGYGVTALGFDEMQLLTAATIGGLLQFVTVPLFGVLATRIGSARVVALGALGTLLIAFPIYWLLGSATFAVLVALMIIGGILPTASWAALGGTMQELFRGRHAYSALSVAYALAAVLSGFIPSITAALGAATDEAWWHPGLVLALLSALTLVGAVIAGRMRKLGDEDADAAQAAVAETVPEPA
ncbi:MFS transporter [Agrococcus carbonis]|uniref:Major Facilitator Superfamily protein n=1 Tax=Agrococcus carbonis TaxID=684552 RepID=A0A1H1T6J7_9MICO|nr:MFS transporter [Agrococcus carbonis]SDS55784.1 Major Facilitator Superfamily protein [Agrococcus carbonis]